MLVLINEHLEVSDALVKYLVSTKYVHCPLRRRRVKQLGWIKVYSS